SAGAWPSSRATSASAPSASAACPARRTSAWRCSRSTDPRAEPAALRHPRVGGRRRRRDPPRSDLVVRGRTLGRRSRTLRARRLATRQDLSATLRSLAGRQLALLLRAAVVSRVGARLDVRRGLAV